MKRIFTLFALLSLVLSSPAQRMLTPNPTFDIGSVPDSLGSAASCMSYVPVTGFGGNGTPDYFKFNPWHPCVSTPVNEFGSQSDLSGDGYLGMMFGGEDVENEYVGIRLVEPTVIGNRYVITVTVSLAENSGYYSDNLGISIAGNLILPKHSGFKIDSPNQWQTFTDTIVAAKVRDVVYVGSVLESAEVTPIGNGGRPYCYVYLGEFSVVDLDQEPLEAPTVDVESYSLISRHNILGQSVNDSFQGLVVETYKSPKGEYIAQSFLRK